jgi:hypothetical protein
VTATRLGKAPHQRVGGGVQEQRAHRNTALREFGQLRGHLGQRGRTAHVHRDSHARRGRLFFECDEGQQQLGRQVVDAVVAGVFEGAQRHRLARPGHAGDQDQL